jgi:serine/threonine protein kinase
MPLSAGDKLGPYEILASIGAGGMGEVYRARDARLDRFVAVKISAAQFSERFEREAKAIAALNHPNICQIYDIGPNYAGLGDKDQAFPCSNGLSKFALTSWPFI